ncbi:hypothetical protein JCM24511_00654 [Saitozyma sp. JCM 24511]|nr:hypothetical protein JCM24511_00654 [Saitozyma sp. JCM 24511]
MSSPFNLLPGSSPFPFHLPSPSASLIPASVPSSDQVQPSGHSNPNPNSNSNPNPNLYPNAGANAGANGYVLTPSSLPPGMAGLPGLASIPAVAASPSLLNQWFSPLPNTPIPPPPGSGNVANMGNVGIIGNAGTMGTMGLMGPMSGLGGVTGSGGVGGVGVGVGVGVGGGSIPGPSGASAGSSRTEVDLDEAIRGLDQAKLVLSRIEAVLLEKQRAEARVFAPIQDSGSGVPGDGVGGSGAGGAGGVGGVLGLQAEYTQLLHMLASLCHTHLIGALPAPLSLASAPPPKISGGSGPGSRPHPAGAPVGTSTSGHGVHGTTQSNTPAIDTGVAQPTDLPGGLSGLHGSTENADLDLSGQGQERAAGSGPGSGLAIGNMDVGSGAPVPPEPVLPGMSDLSRWAEERAALEFSRREGVRLGSRAVLDVLKGSGR